MRLGTGFKRVLLVLMVCFVWLVSLGSVLAQGEIGVVVRPSEFTIQDEVLQGDNTEDKSVKISIENAGNEKEHFKITPQGFILVKPDQFTLDAGEVKQVELFLNIPDNAPLGKRTDTFRVFAEGDITKQYNAEVEVKVTYTIGDNKSPFSLYWLIILIIVLVILMLILIWLKRKQNKRGKHKEDSLDRFKQQQLQAQEYSRKSSKE